MRGVKVHRPSRETLEYLYVVESQTMRDIAMLYRTSVPVVSGWLYTDGLATVNENRRHRSLASRDRYGFGSLSQLYDRHFYHFKWMQDRAKHVGTEFPRTAQGFLDFISYVGPIPDDMVQPSIGRRDHSLGYVKGNFGWQSMFDNSREVALRIKPNTHRKY